jgi:nitrate/nitrite transport system ATP-binding protein
MSAAAAKIIELSMHKQNSQPANDASKPLVELKNVCKSYGEGNSKTSILKDINLHIKEGEFIAIFGFFRQW